MREMENAKCKKAGEQVLTDKNDTTNLHFEICILHWTESEAAR